MGRWRPGSRCGRPPSPVPDDGAGWATAIPVAAEGRRLAIEFGEPMWEAGAETVAATIAGMRGDTEAAEAAAARPERQGLAAGTHATVALAQVGRVLGAL